MFLACLSLAAALFCAGFGPPVLRDGVDHELRLYPEQIAALVARWQAPQITAVAALVVDVDTGSVLYAREEHKSLPPASTAKMMTALLTLRHAALTDRVVVSARAATVGGSTMGLVEGETLTVGELLYGLLLPSGNDAAVALAEFIGGTEEQFVTSMNATAVELGLLGTHFANPHGLDDPEQLSTAADLALLARVALAYPEFARIVALPSAEVAGHALANTNELIGVYQGADGVKTGTTDEAGECLVASVTRSGHRLLVVLLGSHDRYADARLLLNYAESGWAWKPLQLDDDALAWLPGPDGRLYRLKPAGSADVFVESWQWPLVRYVRVVDPDLPLTGPQPAAALRMTLGDQVLGSVPLTVWHGP